MSRCVIRPVSIIVAALAAALPAQAPLRATASGWHAEALREVLPKVLGRPIEVVAVDAPTPPGDAASWLVDEWTLSRWIAGGSAAAAIAATPGVGEGIDQSLPFLVEYVLLAATEFGPSRIRTWEELALEAELHDRFALPDAAVDGGPWAAMLRDALDRGAGLSGAKALWTTIDARAAAGADAGPTSLAAIAAGRLRAVVVPSGPALRLPDAVGLARHPLVAARVRLGVALPPGQTEWRAALAGLDRAAWERLARELALEPAPPGPPPLPGDLAADLWIAYGSEVRGRGRDLEQLADWLDLGFALASLGVLLLVWRRLRRSETGNLA